MIDKDRFDEIKSTIKQDVTTVFSECGFELIPAGGNWLFAHRGDHAMYEVEITHDNVRHPSFGNIVVSFGPAFGTEKLMLRNDKVHKRSFKVEPKGYDREDVAKKIERYTHKLIADCEEKIQHAERVAEDKARSAAERLKAIRAGIDGVEGASYNEEKDRIVYHGVELELTSWKDGLRFRVTLGRNRNVWMPLNKIATMIDMAMEN